MEGTHIWVGEYGSPATPGAWSGNSSMTSDLGALLTLSGLPLGVGLLGGALLCPIREAGDWRSITTREAAQRPGLGAQGSIWHCPSQL